MGCVYIQRKKENKVYHSDTLLFPLFFSPSNGRLYMKASCGLQMGNAINSILDSTAPSISAAARSHGVPVTLSPTKVFIRRQIDRVSFRSK